MYQIIPGTVTPYSSINGSIFALFDSMISSADGLSLSQVCSITGLETSTVQNWVKRGFVANPIKKRYYARHIARILIINAMRDCMQLEQTISILKYLNGDVEDESDDSVAETDLFDYFCSITKDISIKNGISYNDVDLKIKDTLKDFKGKHTDSANKLYKTLKIMTLTYAASLYKQEAEQYINSI